MLTEHFQQHASGSFLETLVLKRHEEILTESQWTSEEENAVYISRWYLKDADHNTHLIHSAESDFSWANAGAAVFERVQVRDDGEEENSDEEAPKNDDIHFEPIVSLPEVFHTALLHSSVLKHISISSSLYNFSMRSESK